jgi:FAD/FMN-containing dehydrogenase
MVGNNSCGARSPRYGNTRENVIAVDAILADDASAHFGPAAHVHDGNLQPLPAQPRSPAATRVERGW